MYAFMYIYICKHVYLNVCACVCVCKADASPHFVHRRPTKLRCGRWTNIKKYRSRTPTDIFGGCV